MPPRDWTLYIQDILEAITKIHRYTEGMDFETFRQDPKTVDAVIRNFTVIGEATRYVPPEMEGRFPEIPWGKMRGMRNVIVHEYPSIDLTVIWDAVQRNLLPLEPMLQRVLEEYPLP